MLLVTLSAAGTDFYWVGGPGRWNDPAHWSDRPGGMPGILIPGDGDVVYFNTQSGLKSGDGVVVEGSIICEGIHFLDPAADFKIRVAAGVLIQTSSSADYSTLNKYLTHRQVATGSDSNSTAKFIAAPVNHTCSIVVITDNLCPGLCNGVATVNVNPPGSYSYLWSNGQTTQTATGLCTGQGYIVQVIDNNNPNDVCQAGIIMTNYLPFGSFFNNVNPLCNSWCTGQSTINVIGGTVPYSYLWTPSAQTSNVATGLCAGTYTINVTDANGCTYSATTTITQPTAISPNPTQTNVLCNPNCTGVATVTPTGGTPPYNYVWAPGGQTTNSITGQCAGTYTVTITDANGCTRTQAITITQPPQALNVTVNSAGNPVACNGDCTASATATPSGGTAPYSYSWSPGGQTTANITGLCAGTYTVTVTDANGCTSTQTITITEPPILTLSLTTTNNPLLCFNQCNATASATVGGGTPTYSYLWSPGNQTTANVTGLCAGTYTVIVTDANGCTISQTVTITQPPQLTVNITTTNNPLTCFNQCIATATANPGGGTPGYFYLWSPGGQTTQGISSLCAGTYTVTVTDANGCTRTQTVTITQPPQITINITTTNNPLACNGNCNATATANVGGGSPPYSYSWNTVPVQTTQTATGLCAGTYTVTITDNLGCTRTASVIITQPTLLTTTQSSSALQCNGDCTANLGVSAFGGTAPYQYAWQPGGQTTSSITGQCAGTYTVTVTDANGCTSSQVINVTQPTPLNIFTVTNNPSCNNGCDGSASALGGGGNAPYTYLWAPGGQTTSNITGLCPGTYTVTITDANGCTASTTITITNPPPVNTGVTTQNVLCNGQCNGSATANPSGGTAPYSYQWQPGNQTSATITGLCAGSYTLTVTDANGCTVSQIVTITQPAPLVAQITATTTSCNICNGTATANAVGGTAPFSYLWNPTGQTTQAATGLCPGQYTVTITDANGCTATAVANVFQTVQIIITTSTDTLDCNGDCDGIATAIASGGTLPYSYLWNTFPIQTTQSATGLCAGTFTVTVTDANGCFGTATVTFADPPALTLSLSGTNLLCNNICIGTATATPGGGTPGYTYSWNTVPVQTTQTATGLCAGSYIATVTDANGCTITSSITITEPSPVTIAPTFTLANCNICDGVINLNPSGGTAPYTYVWVPNVSNGPTANNVCAGIYSVTITDANGCTFTFTVTLNNNSGPSLTMTSTPTTCYGDCDGTATVTANGGTPPYTYLWSPGGQTTSTATGLCQGTYTVQVTDQPGCISFNTVTINQPAPFSAPAVIVNSSCATPCNGSINITPTGGTAPYTYLWMPGNSTTEDLTGLCAGTYTLTITDANLCDSTFTYTITAPPAVTVTVNSTNVNCNNACDGTAIANPSGGVGNFTYLWMPGNFSTQNIVNLCPGVYTVTVTDGNGCTASATVTITEPPVLTLILTSSTPPLCNSSCDGTATVTAGGGNPAYTYLWSPGGFTTATVTALCGLNYTVTVTDANGCTAAIPVNIVPPVAVNTGLQTFNASCNSACNGAAISTPTGGTGPYQYLWMPGSLTTSTVNGLCPGSYTLTVTDANGCTASTIFTITAPNVLQAGGFVSTLPSCPNSCDAVITANPVGGTPPYSYLWLPVNATTQTVTGVCGQTTYTLQVTDANGCIGQQILPVNDPPAITATPAIGQANCGVCNGTIAIVAAGGSPPYTYLWAPGNQTTASITGLCAGLYTVTVTDAGGCTSSFIYGVSNTTGPSLVMSFTGTTCPGDCDGTAGVVATGTGPFTYVWSPGGATTASVTGLCAGQHFVTVTDANSCITIDSVNIQDPPNILANANVTNASCSGICDGSILINPSGGNGGPYTYLWLPGNQTTSSITGLCVGTYSVIITDVQGCLDTIAVNVLGNTVIAFATTSTNIQCSNVCTGTAMVINLVGGTAPYSYSWTDPFGQFTPQATGLCAGTYTVTVTDANGCFTTQSVTITATPPIVVTSALTPPSCGMCNGQIVLTPTGGTAPYTYIWNNGQTTASVTGICAGLYQVTITDANGCSQTFNIPVSNPGAPTPNVTIVNPPCSNTCTGSATAAPTGGTAPYTYNWLPGGQTTSSINGLCPGTYYVQVIDANGCITTDTVVISAPTQIQGNPMIIHTDCGACQGSITMSPSGGTAPYTYLWLPGNQVTAGISNLCAGVYTVTITDANGCTESYTIPVTNVNGPSVSLTTVNLTCNSGCIGSATATVSGGTPPYSYNWSNGGTTSSITGLCSGTYTLTVIDANNCSTLVVATITGPPAILFSAPVVVQPLCNGDCNGSVTALPLGGTLPFTFLWSNGSTNPSITGLCFGTYTVTVTDANGCTATQTMTLNNPPAITVTNVNVTPSSCNTVNDGGIDITVTGGTGALTYAWSNGATTQDLSAILSGTYSVVITDANGCSTSTTVIVNSNVSVIADAGSDTSACAGSSYMFNGSGSVNASSYQWYEIPSMTNLGTNPTIVVNNPNAGTYTYILITQNGGCSDTDTVMLTVNPLPFANAGNDQSIVVNGNTTIGGSPTGPGGSTYLWQPSTGLSDSLAANPIASPTITTTYTVIVTSADGCTALDSITVTVLPEIIFPNGISPNGDGSNDTWIIDNIHLFPNNWVEVYNRWGELLYHGDGYDNTSVFWDGTYKGKNVPVGTYYYIINLNDPMFPDVFTGPITVYR
ncbi:MAG: gliding motility-associated C-terminal domain-containing protein [Bacteroidia bacterium]|nr:gliding motility-associated C-terminal domain-containing protein [Bacteroidia bacterium]